MGEFYVVVRRERERITWKVVVTFYWQKSVAQEAVFLYSVRLKSAQLHVYWTLVSLNDVNRQTRFVLGCILFLTLNFLFFSLSLMMILFSLTLFKAFLWFPPRNHQKVWGWQRFSLSKHFYSHWECWHSLWKSKKRGEKLFKHERACMNCRRWLVAFFHVLPTCRLCMISPGTAWHTNDTFCHRYLDIYYQLAQILLENSNLSLLHCADSPHG